MDCCAHYKGLNQIFDERLARAEVDAYWKKGIDRHARRLVEAVSAGAQSLAGGRVLEVGGGIGGLQVELFKRGAAAATNVEISAAYLAAAQTIAQKLGLRDRIEYRRADFAHEAQSIPAADIVVMHRVVCCYPDMPALVTAAAQHARRRLALTYPHAAWYMRLGQKVINFGMWVTRSGFRFYLHRPEGIVAAAHAAGLRLIHRQSSWPWRIMVFERGASG